MTQCQDIDFKNKHNVAFLSTDLALGGSTTFHINLAGEMVRRGVSTRIFSLSEINPLASDFKQRGIPVTCARSKGIITEDRIIWLLGQMRDFNPDVVVSDISFSSCELLRYLPKKLTRIGVIHIEHPALHETAKTYLNEMNYIITVSKKLQELFAAVLGKEHQKCLTLELGVPMPKAVDRSNLKNGEPLRILYLGRLEDRAKRVRTFPGIFERLKESGIPFVWTIAGEGSERAFLESQLISKNLVQIIKLCGTVPYNQVPSLIAEHDIILLTSDSEAFPLGLQEGMAGGLVPVASSIQGRVSEIVTSLTGVPVEPDNTAGYADAIIWLHKNREVMLKMSAAAREMIRPYSIEAMADRWLEFIGNLPTEHIDWPSSWKILRPLKTQLHFRFSPPMRMLRRLAARLNAQRY